VVLPPWKVVRASSGRLTSNSNVKVPTMATISSGRAIAGTRAAYRNPARSCPRYRHRCDQAAADHLLDERLAGGVVPDLPGQHGHAEHR